MLGASSMVDEGAVLALRGDAGNPVLTILGPRNAVRSSKQLGWLNHTAGMVVIAGHEVMVLLCPIGTHNATVHVVSFSGAPSQCERSHTCIHRYLHQFSGAACELWLCLWHVDAPCGASSNFPTAVPFHCDVTHCLTVPAPWHHCIAVPLFEPYSHRAVSLCCHCAVTVLSLCSPNAHCAHYTLSRSCIT